MIDVFGNQLVEVDENGEKLGDICEAIEIVGKTANFVSGDTKIAMRISIGETPQVFVVERAILSPNNIYNFLVRKGVHIAANKETLEAVSEYLFECDKEVPTTYIHDRLGFIDMEEGIAFLHKNPIGRMLGSKASSEYTNSKEVACNGTLEGWLEVVEEEIQGHTPMELALATGFSAVIAHLLRRENVYAEIPVVGFIGDSSTGKTTAAKVSASPFGPITEGVGLVKDVNATKNAFFKILERQTGLPQILDETTGRRDWNLSDTIYELVKGKSKAVCNTSSELKDQTSFSGTVIITGEKSIFDNGKVQTGMLARVSEFQNVPWTKDADHSRRICEKFNANHGTAVVPFVTYVLELYENQPEELKTMFKEELKTLHTLMPNLSGVEERILNIFATILISAEIANASLGISLDVDEIRKLLVGNHQKNAPVETQAENLYQYLLERVVQDASSYPDKKKSERGLLRVTNMKGEVTTEDYHNVVYIAQHNFVKMAEEKFPNYNTLIPILADKGLMKKDKHRHYKFKRTLNLSKVYCYGLLIRDLEAEEAMRKKEEELQRKKLKRKKTSQRIAQSPQMVNLLADDDDEIIEAKVVEEVINGESDLQNHPQQSESEANEELQAS